MDPVLREVPCEGLGAVAAPGGAPCRAPWPGDESVCRGGSGRGTSAAARPAIAPRGSRIRPRGLTAPAAAPADAPAAAPVAASSAAAAPAAAAVAAAGGAVPSAYPGTVPAAGLRLSCDSEVPSGSGTCKHHSKLGLHSIKYEYMLEKHNMQQHRI